MTRILVTGASGFVARHLVPAAVARGHTVIGVGNDAPPADLPFEAWHALDLRNENEVDACLTRSAPDWVIHLAAQSSAAHSFEAPGETFETNVIGTWNLLQATRRAAPRARILVVGTGEVYGPHPEGTRAREDDPFRPVSPYAVSKAAADVLAGAAHERFGLDVIRTRSFGHVGPGQTVRFFLPSFAQQIARIEAGDEPVLRVGNLDVVRDLCDVRDVVGGYLRLLEDGRPGGVYNVCRGAGVRLADLVADLVGRARVPIRVQVDPARVRPADVPYLVGDPGRIRADVGWSAAIPIEQSVAEVLEEWRGKAPGETGPSD